MNEANFFQDLTVNVMSDMPSTEVEFVEDPDEIHRIFKQSFIDEQEFYLYKYIDSESKELQKDRADPFVRRSVLTVRCRAARRPWCFIWNHFAVTVRIVQGEARSAYTYVREDLRAGWIS